MSLAKFGSRFVVVREIVEVDEVYCESCLMCVVHAACMMGEQKQKSINPVQR